MNNNENKDLENNIQEDKPKTGREDFFNLRRR
jgi:hypothetical protein